jgi:hypothetical protein
MRFKSVCTAGAALFAIILASAGASAQSKVTGVFKGNDKPATLTQVTSNGPHKFHDLKWEVDLTFETRTP